MSQPDEEDDQDFSCIHKHYDFGPILGEGNFSSVNLCQHRITRESVAIKVLEKNRIKNHEDLERIGREIRIMRKVRHPHIIQFYEIQESKEHLYFVMEYANGGELYEHIVKNKRLLEPEACHIFHQLLQAIEYTHNLGIAHRDIKPENILLDSNHDIKFIDFGLGQTYSSDELLSTACGSPCYAAPEMVARKKYNGMKVDIWSSGITLYAMLCGYLPFDDEDLTNLYSKILKGDFVIPNHISKEAGDLIKKILVTDPTKRINLEEIKQHSWLKIRLLFRIPRKPFSLATMTEIDEEILMLVSGYGFEYNEVRDAVENNYLSPLTTTYYLLLRKKVLGNFDDIDLEILEKQKNLAVTGSPNEKFAETESTHGRRLKTEGNCEYGVNGECEESDRFDLEKLSDGTAEHSLNFEQNLCTEDISNQINSNTSEAINLKEPESSKYHPNTEKDPRSVKVSYPNVNNSKNSFSNQGSGSNQGIDTDNLRLSTSEKNDYPNRGTTAEELKKLITSEKLDTPKESSVKNLGKAYYYKCSGKEGTKTVQEKPNSNSNFHVHQNINQQYHNNNFIIQNPNYKFTNPVIIHHQHNLTEGQGSEIIQEYSNSGQVMENRFADSDGSKILEKGYPGQKSQSQSQTHSTPQAQALSIAQSHAQSLAQVQSINYDRNSQLQATKDKKRLVKKSIASNRYQNIFHLKNSRITKDDSKGNKDTYDSSFGSNKGDQNLDLECQDVFNFGTNEERDIQAQASQTCPGGETTTFDKKKPVLSKGDISRKKLLINNKANLRAAGVLHVSVEPGSVKKPNKYSGPISIELMSEKDPKALLTEVMKVMTTLRVLTKLKDDFGIFCQRGQSKFYCEIVELKDMSKVYTIRIERPLKKSKEYDLISMKINAKLLSIFA